MVIPEVDMPVRPQTRLATTTARTQYCGPDGRDAYATTTLEVEASVVIVTICGPGDLICESRRITNPDVMAFVRWHLDTVADLTRRTGASTIVSGACLAAARHALAATSTSRPPHPTSY